MPFIDGKRVSVSRWRALQPKRISIPEVSEDEAENFIKEAKAAAGASVAKVRTPSKAAQAKAAILAATGATAVSLDGESKPVLVAIDLDEDVPGGVIGGLEFTPGVAVADLASLDAE